MSLERLYQESYLYTRLLEYQSSLSDVLSI